jgi:hypothetical protein
MPFLEIYFDAIPWDLFWRHSLRFILMTFLEIYFDAIPWDLLGCHSLRFILMPFLEIYFDAIPWDLFWCHSLRFNLMTFLEIYFDAIPWDFFIKIMKSKIICVSMEINGYHIWGFFLQYVIFDLWVNNYFQLKSLRWMNRFFFFYCHMIYLR